MAVKPFYYETDGVWLLPITPQQADELYLDTKLWVEWAYRGRHFWFESHHAGPPSTYQCKWAMRVDPPEHGE